MTAGGGRRPPGGPPRVPRSLASAPDGEWPGQVVSLDEIWHTEALFNALAANGAVPGRAASDPAAGLLAALRQDVDPSVPAATAAQPGTPGAPRWPGRRAGRRWPVRALITGLVAAAAVVLVAVVQPPWPTGDSKTAASPLAVQLQPTLQVRLPGQHHPAPGHPPLTGPAALMPPPATGDSQPGSLPSRSSSIPADARSGPAGAARAGLPGNAAPAGASHGFGPGRSLPATASPVRSLPAPIGSPAGRAPAWPSSPAGRRHGAPRRPPSRPGNQHPRPGPRVPAPTGSGAAGARHGAAGAPRSGARPSPAGSETKPWQFWLRGLGRPRLAWRG